MLPEVSLDIPAGSTYPREALYLREGSITIWFTACSRSYTFEQVLSHSIQVLFVSIAFGDILGRPAGFLLVSLQLRTLPRFTGLYYTDYLLC